MSGNQDAREEIRGPVVLKNRTCGYCGQELSRDTATKEHLIGRGTVPKGSLDGQWNLIFKACRACNGAKSDLEDDISVVALQPDAAGRFHPHTEPSVKEEALRKSRKSFSRRTGQPVGSSHERFSLAHKTGPMTMTFSYIGPPSVDEGRIAELARFQVVGLLYWLTYDEDRHMGGFVEGDFYPLRSALRSDWGNALHRGFMQRVATWENRLVGHTAGGYFQVAIRKMKDMPCWSWALEWNRNIRAIGFLGDQSAAAGIIGELPALEFDSSFRTDDGTAWRRRREQPLPEEEDRLFQMEE